MAKEHDSRDRKGKGKVSEYNSADPRAQEASQAASGSRRSTATTGTREEVRTTGQGRTRSQAGSQSQASATAQNSATTTATATTTHSHPRTLLPFWSRPHPRFGTAEEPVDRFRRERRPWNPVGRPRRVSTTFPPSPSFFQDSVKNQLCLCGGRSVMSVVCSIARFSNNKGPGTKQTADECGVLLGTELAGSTGG